jgi:hypothetical protein
MWMKIVVETIIALISWAMSAPHGGDTQRFAS